MKLKEIERTANVAWSPASQYPVYLACGTAAQQLDASFNTKACLEIFRYNPEEPGFGCEFIAATETNHRFNKIIWSSLGIASEKYLSGLVVGAAENGLVQVWDASKVIMEEPDSVILNLEKHEGSVNTLDFNKHQENLLASGGSNSEILLWDLNNPSTPMTPGAKSQPADDVTCLSWNCQVQHILASALNTRCVVWDLRKSEPIIKISDSMSRIRSKLVTWHPEVATQLVLASEDDHTPVVQLWDLRFAASPVKVLEKHERGILSMAWSPRDPDLFLTCGKDNRLLCWNPNADVVGGEVTCELPVASQWCFDVQWCPQHPQCFSACSFDGRVSVYTIMGGEMTTQPLTSSSKIADSFGGFDSFATPQAAPKSETKVIPQVSKAPKWLKRPSGVSFAFGGKLVTFSSLKSKDPNQSIQNTVAIHQVVSEKDLVKQSHQLEHAIHNRQYHEYCSLKIANCKKQQDQMIWRFLQTSFENDSRNKFLNVLGFDANNLKEQVATVVSDGSSEPESSTDSNVVSSGNDQQSTAADEFEQLSLGQQAEIKELKFNPSAGVEGLLTQALLTGNFNEAVEICLHENRLADAVILAHADGPELLKKTMAKYFKQCTSPTSQLISAIVQKDHQQLVDSTHIDNWKEALAIILTYSKCDDFPQLCDTLGGRLESSGDPSLSSNAMFCYICSGNIDKFVECWLRHNSEGKSSAVLLQELIEKVTMLRKAYEHLHGQEYTVKARSPLAGKLGQYAELLAAEGGLKTALTYLGGPAQSQKLAILRYRLAMALGQQVSDSPWPKSTVATAQPTQNTAAQVHSRSKGPKLYNNSLQQNYSTSQYATNTYQQPAARTQPANQQYNAMSAAQPVATQSYYPSQNTTSSYSAYNGSAQTEMSPSTYNYSASSQQYNYQPQPQYTQSPYGSAATPTSYNQQQTGYPNQPSYGGGYQNYGQQPVGHVSARGLLSKKYAASTDSGQQSAVSSHSPATSFYNPASAVNSMASSAANNPNLYSPVPPPQPAMPAVPVPSVDDLRKAPSGWNDPPPVHSKKEPESPNTSSHVAPITQPVYNPNAMMQPMVPGGAYQQQQIPQQYGAPSMMPQQQQYNQPQPHSPQQMQPPSPKAPPTIEKGPLPDRHKVIKEVLDLLANKCLGVSTNPQQKRKLADVLRKLESLYDKLRSNTLNDSVLTGLHQIVSAIKQYDYATGLAVHANLVMQGNFSEISAFMPGIKMLMQTAHQLQVFV